MANVNNLWNIIYTSINKKSCYILDLFHRLLKLIITNYVFVDFLSFI